MQKGRDEMRAIRVPGHRYTPLKEHWETIVKPIVGASRLTCSCSEECPSTNRPPQSLDSPRSPSLNPTPPSSTHPRHGAEHLKLQIRMNTKARAVEIKTSAYTSDVGALQKAEDFVKAFMLGFDVGDAVALLRLDDLYVESFEVTDVKPLKGDHLGRAIGRIAGIGGKTKHAIENATRTRIVVADAKVHVLGAFANIAVARDALCALILGSPPGKVYHQMHQIAARMQQRY